MGLEIETTEKAASYLREDRRNDPVAVKDAVLVSTYLQGALKAMRAHSPIEHEETAANKYMMKHRIQVDSKETALEVVKNMQKELDQQEQAASLKTKIEYKVGGTEGIAAIAMGAASVVAGVVASVNGIEAMQTIAAAVGCCAPFLMADAIGKAEEKQGEVRAYAEVKQAQYVLKKMEKRLTAKENKNASNAVALKLARARGGR